MGKKSKQQSKEDVMDVTEAETSINVKTDGKSSYEDLLNHVSIIAKPMASRKLTKKIYKMLKKGMFNQLNNFMHKLNF